MHSISASIKKAEIKYLGLKKQQLLTNDEKHLTLQDKSVRISKYLQPAI
jgi:GTP cyclohydrolase II